MFNLITEPRVLRRNLSRSVFERHLSTESDKRRTTGAPSESSEESDFVCLWRRVFLFCFFGGVRFFSRLGGDARLFFLLGERLGEVRSFGGGLAAAAAADALSLSEPSLSDELD